ncbi:MAG: hypothetical protein WC261_10325 [Synergistaceae bacterium]|jgi:uncharacterized protein YdaU (DUF1376 family)
MALRDQPYIPLYVQDFLTDEKLMECSASATGIYIRLLCVMHKSEEYGTILLKQKDKQGKNICLNFAYKLAKFLPYKTEEIAAGIEELVAEKVLQIDGDKLTQKRMIRDNEISEKRAIAGKKGGLKTQQFASEFAKAKFKANTEYENENEYEYENEIDFKKKGKVQERKKDLGIQVKKPTYASLFDKVLKEENLQLPEGFYELILEWLKYKSEKGQTYKETGLKNFIIKIMNDSGGRYQAAKNMIFYSVSNNYAGLFKEKANGRTEKTIAPATDIEIADILLKHFGDE